MKKIGIILLLVFLITINIVTPISAETTNEVADTTGVQKETTIENTEENIEIVEEEQSEEKIKENQEQISITPFTEVTNGGVTLNVPDYNATDKWNVETVYNVSVNVNFADAVSTDKQIKITLPEGMRYVSIPVHETQGNAGKDVEVQADSILTGAITSVVMPTANTLYKTIDNKNNYHGDLIYNIIPGMTGVEIKGLQVTVDGSVYYEPKTIIDGIKIEATQNGGTLVGNTSLDIITKGNADYTFFSSGSWKEFSIMEGETEPFNLNYVSVYRSGELYPKSVFNKKYEVTYYYPKEFTYVGHNATGYTLTEVNETEGYIKLVRDNYFYNGTGSFNLKVKNDAGLPVGTYTAKGPKFEITTYDDKIVTRDYTNSPTLQTKINVLSASDPMFNNQLNLEGKNMGYTDLSDDYFVMGPLFNFNTPTSKGKDAQVLEYFIDPNYEVVSVAFPTGTQNGITAIEYKTNLNSNIQIATGTEIKEGSIIYVSSGIYAYNITKESLGLQENEYITYAKASVGDLPKDFSRTLGNANYMTHNILGMIGRLKTGVTSANVTVNSWSEPTPGVIEAGSENSLTRTVSRNLDQTSVYNTGITDYSVNAGATQKITGTLATHTYYYSYTLGIVNPTIYIRQPEGLSIDPNTFVLKQGATILTPTNITEETLALTGEKVLKVETNMKIGSFFGENLSTKQTLTYSFDLKADITATGNYTWNDLIFFETTNGLSAANSQLAAQPDIYDVNNNGNTTEKLGTPNKNKLNIIEQKVLTLDTYITPEGENRKPAYDTSNASTAIGFTPGTKADYTIDLFNNRDDSVDKFISYIPIPKTGTNFGEQFQSESFKWDMKLDSGSTATIEVYDRDGNLLPGEAANYVLSYSEDEVASNFTDSGFYTGGVSAGTYTSSITNATSMIKLEKTTPIQSGERVVVTFKYEVNETSTSAAGKLSTINDFRPYYYFKAGSEGFQSGTRVGARLEIGEISGLLFEDVNVNGIYDIGDIVTAGKTVRLYQKDSGGVYVEHASSPVLTAADGSYKFEGLGNGVYKVDFNDAVIAGSQEFTLRKQGTDDSKDSDVQYSGLNRGIVENIDATADSAKLVTAGYITYNASTDLNITGLPSSVSMQASNGQVTNTTNVNGTITPSFFNAIKASNNAIAWTSSDTSIVSTTSGTASGVLTAGQSTGSTETATLTVTLTDMYGYTKVVTIPVTITSNDIPVVSGSDMTIEAGTTFDKLTTGITISDTEDGSIALTDTKVTITDNVPVNGSNQAVTPGTYTVIYAVEDTDGNTASKTINVTVEDTTAPTITTTSTSETVEANSTSTLPDWEAVFGVSVTDIVDGDITSDTSKVTYNVSPSYTANNIPGTYTITVTATDTEGNTSTTTLTYIVEDTTAPSITTTSTSETVEANTTSTLPDWETVFGVNVTDIVTGDITSDTSKVTYSVSPSYTANNIPGTYTITVTATDTEGNTSTTTLTYIVEDTTAPVITTTSTSETVEANSTTTLPDWETVFGVSVTDIVDGDITSDTSKVTYSVSPSYTANNIPGTYTITVTATDTEGNTSTTTVTYIVEDTTAPSITTTSTSETVEANSTSTLPDWKTVFGVNVTDIADGDITSDTSKVTYSVSPSYTANNIPGTYTITVTATDTAGNSSTTTLTYIVEDTTAPVITTTSTSETVEANTTSTLPDWETVFGVNVTDIVDGDITSDTSKVTYSVSPSYTANNIPGTYTITVTATDTAGNSSTTTLTYIVTDTAAPVITTTDTTVTVEANAISTLPNWETVFGVSVTDIVDGDITSDTSKVTYSVSPAYTANNIPGTYTITVTATDTAGNSSTTTLTYIVEDTTAPVITTTSTSETIEANSTSTLPDWETVFGVNVTDIVDGDITSDTSKVTYSVSPSYTANNIPGTYTITVTATDTAGNSSTTTLTYIVEDTTAPVITTTSTSETVEANSTSTLPDWETVFGVNVTDIADGDITSDTSKVTYSVSPSYTANNIPGTYTITVTATDTAGNTSTTTLTYIVEDTTNPILSITNPTVYVAKGDVHTEAALKNLVGATATDVTGTPTVAIDMTSIDFDTEGTYTTTVTATDASNNTATGIITVEVIALLTAENFTIALPDVASADFVTLANAYGWELNTSITTKTASVVTLESAKPTTVGLHDVTFKNAEGIELTVQILITNEAAVNNEAVTASNFVVTLSEVATADFITLANAKGYDITDPRNPIEVPVLETTARPTTVGLHTVRFETANGGYAEVEVLVTNEAPVNNETVVANNFTVTLSEVATADFITLANAKGYDITDPRNPIEVPVLETTARPTTVGLHIVRFETANGGYAEVQVLVTNEAPVNNETVVANNFTVTLSEVATADFITLANAKGYDITDPTNPIEIPVTLVSEKPETVGVYIARFETINGGYAEVNVIVTSTSADYNFEAVDFEINLSELKQVIELGNLETEIINRSNAKVVNLVTAQEETGIKVSNIEKYETFDHGVYNILLTYEIAQNASDTYDINSNNEESNINQIGKSIQMTVLDDSEENSGNNSEDILPQTGEQYIYAIFGSFVLLISSIIFYFIHLRKQEEN